MGRAARMAPDERRRAIVDAVVPLLLQHGRSVTTRQIAEAAGIAEGTIFRAFPDIESLIQTTIDAAYDPATVARELADLMSVEPLERRLADAVRILQARLTNVWQLMSISGLPKPKAFRDGSRKRHARPDVAALVALFEGDAAEIRRPAIAAAQLLRGLTLAGTHPALTAEAGQMEPEEIVSVLLDGIRR